MRAVNLLPSDHARKRSVTKENLPLVVGACAGVLVTVVIASQFLSQSGKVTAEQQTVDNLKSELAGLPAPPPGPTAQETKVAGEQSVRLTALNAAMKTRVAWDRVLRQFSLVLPEDVWLTSLSLKSPVSPSTNTAPAVSTSPTGLTMEGGTYSHDAVARLLSRLAVVPDLTNVQLVNSTMSAAGGQKTVHFSIAADIKDASAKGSS